MGQIRILSGREATVAYDVAVREEERQIGHAPLTSIGVVRGVDFTPAQNETVRAMLTALRPLTRCGPALQIMRMDRVMVNRQRAENGGISYQTQGVIAIAEHASWAPYGFAGVLAHELGHQLMQALDPATCGDYARPRLRVSPLLQRWADTMGWRTLSERTDRVRPTGEHAATTALEDMAAAFGWYMTDRAALRRVNPDAVPFFDRVFRELGAAPPPQISQPL